MLSIQNYSICIGNVQILYDCTLTLLPGTVHVLMGPNGSGKSSLAASLMGHPAYQVIHGTVKLGTTDLLSLSISERSLLGMYLAVQHPIEIEGLEVLHFLQELYRVRQVAHKASVDSFADILIKIRELLEIVGLPESILKRNVNVGFSGGEKKRFELLQLLLLQPTVIILDEIDSGVDVDGLKMISSGLLWYKQQHPEVCMLIVTHYQKIVDYIQADIVHVMLSGRIVRSGGKEILDDIERFGYNSYAKGT